MAATLEQQQQLPPLRMDPTPGCLSPYFISDAAAKAAPAVVNIMVQASGGLPVGSSGSGFVVDSDGKLEPCCCCTWRTCSKLCMRQLPALLLRQGRHHGRGAP